MQVLLLQLEQCYYCLYGHPNKKARSRGLVDHNAEQVRCGWMGVARWKQFVPFQIPLTWESAQMLIQHYHPLSLPSIDNVKPQLSAEVSCKAVIGWSY